MNPVEQAIWLIESRLGENPTLADVARDTGLSRFYLCRLFADETGTPLSAYVRSRRLSEAAKALMAGTPQILDVALAAGYGSHEAFTRAFRAEFGHPPETVRDRLHRPPLPLKEPLRMKAAQQVPLDAARMADLAPGRYIGLVRTYELSELGRIPGQWEAFQPFLAGLDPARIGAAWGIVRQAGPDGEGIQYLCGVPAGTGLHLTGDLVEWQLPALRVAQFAHRGHISALPATLRAVFESGLPVAGLRPDGEIDLLERYGADFDPRSGFGTIGLWVPVARASD